ncbi:polysaccharide deacetylase family protein [Paenibacillus sp. HWE-109]|uniref:polysaccharide deacetylase family protein n=1 Tax=Paenibacillus sp. HWE-109 TaxID=1306526 RepID=UPI001EDF1EA4|nr:polysaccharide deacetylase family protein [Paenibacillus sp. HWE-109]UKS25302.1 polysaccharide deacetylase family protein [Paenibacillus sp. HWE-109]
MRERSLCFLFFLFAMMALSSCQSSRSQSAAESAEASLPLSATSSMPSPVVSGREAAAAPDRVSESAPTSALSSETPRGEPTVAPGLAPGPAPTPESRPPATVTHTSLSASDISDLVDRYSQIAPHKWGERVAGVRTHMVTKEQVIALTFDACGGKEGSGYDRKLIEYLIKEKIPATLFINARWIAANPEVFAELAANPLFEIENHGTEHRPLSVNGRLAYGIAGTKSVSEVIHEVTDNADQIEKLTGRRPLFFRSGTAYYDDVAASIVHDLGAQLAGYNLLGDAGATYNTEQVYRALLQAKSGSIVLAHMNHPEKDTAEGVIKAIPELQKAGFHFVQLATYLLE